MFKPSVREEADDEDRQMRDSKAQQTSTSSKGGLTEGEKALDIQSPG